MQSRPILTYNNDGVLGTSDDELLVDDAGWLFGTAEPDAVLSWDSRIACETEAGELVGVYDEGGDEVLGLVEPPAVLYWGGAAPRE